VADALRALTTKRTVLQMENLALRSHLVVLLVLKAWSLAGYVNEFANSLAWDCASNN